MKNIRPRAAFSAESLFIRFPAPRYPRRSLLVPDCAHARIRSLCAERGSRSADSAPANRVLGMFPEERNQLFKRLTDRFGTVVQVVMARPRDEVQVLSLRGGTVE